MSATQDCDKHSMMKMSKTGKIAVLGLSLSSFLVVSHMQTLQGEVLGSQMVYKGPVAMYHEQTVAIVTHGQEGLERCRLILAESGDQFDKLDLLRRLATKMPLKPVDFRTMMAVMVSCQQLPGKTYREDKLASVSTNSSQPFDYWALTKGILPGTLWCGLDDIADDYFSLGDDLQLDKCCRTHDHCPVKVKAFQSRYGVFNLSPTTKSHCECDKLFYQCLKGINSVRSNSVGDFFFNMAGMQCIEPRVRRRCQAWHEEPEIQSRVKQEELGAQNAVEENHKVVQEEFVSPQRRKRTLPDWILGRRSRKGRCEGWITEPPDKAKFVMMDPKQEY